MPGHRLTCYTGHTSAPCALCIVPIFASVSPYLHSQLPAQPVHTSWCRSRCPGAPASPDSVSEPPAPLIFSRGLTPGLCAGLHQLLVCQPRVFPVGLSLSRAFLIAPYPLTLHTSPPHGHQFVSDHGYFVPSLGGREILRMKTARKHPTPQGRSEGWGAHLPDTR